MSVSVGTLERKENKDGIVFFALAINLPFFESMDFYVSSNKNKDKEAAPDFLIWHKKNQVGAIWKRVSKNEVSYLSGKVLFMGLNAQNTLWFRVFQNDDSENGTVVVDDQPFDEKKAAVNEQKFQDIPY